MLLARLYRREMDSIFKPHGLTDATAFPLRYLAQAGQPVGQARLAELLAIEGPTLVRVLDQLMEAGLVERLADESDRRARLVRLTRQGQRLNDAIEPELSAMRARLFKGATEEDVRRTLKVLDHLQTNLDAYLAEPADIRPRRTAAVPK
ncbi:MarR family transcriptional regulator [Bordetella ansorpii]|uniref:MarR family transcriptional regulator n=1 Tax=Bordetella ansorpii TaxID=288768 RepID=A0A157QK90_9BORD|nr:MarR family transcriptional regulator [Bordetella ansorpii]